MEEPGATPQPYVWLVLEELCRSVAALPDSNPYGFPWELVIYAAVLEFFAVLFFFRSVRSWLYVGREKELAVALSGLIEEKRKLFEKISLIQKEYEGYEVESSLKNASFEREATETRSLEAACEKLNRSNSEFEDEILCLEKEVKEEKSKHSKQDELMADISKRTQSLEDESKSLKLQLAETAIKDVLSENSQLQEKADVWKEQMSELNKQKITFEDSKVHGEQMKDWAAMLGEDITDDDNLELEMNSESEMVYKYFGIKLSVL
uniref:CTAGE family member 5 n=1 Tax=Aotus nancymaae TaxID=37293 RepID=A0A2K5E0D5_AOTNA